jgi:hypothetical protein
LLPSPLLGPLVCASLQSIVSIINITCVSFIVVLESQEVHHRSQRLQRAAALALTERQAAAHQLQL